MKLRLPKPIRNPGRTAAHYTQRDGAFVLNVEGAADPAQLDELHSANLALTKQLDEHQQRFQASTPRPPASSQPKSASSKKPSSSRPANSRKSSKPASAPPRPTSTSSSRPSASERDSLTDQLAKIQIDQAVLTAATERGLHRSAIPDLLGRARALFRMVKGVPTALEPDGKTVRQTKDGKPAPARHAGWRTSLGEAPHLFDPGVGSAAAGDKTAPRPLPGQSLPQGHLEPHRTNAPLPHRPRQSRSPQSRRPKPNPVRTRAIIDLSPHPVINSQSRFTFHTSLPSFP